MLEYLTESDLPCGVLDIVEVIGIDAFKDLVRHAGGSYLYIPNEKSLVKSFRNKKIRESFKGDYRVIAKQFGITEVQVRNIIKNK